MEFIEMTELLKQLEQLVVEIQSRIDELDKSLHGELETLQLQISNLRS
ncbi:MAG: hypothetical protein LBN94_02735 [Puniceicoccales bacterium]|jgi:hypothetical protein|nr:hypothetical protein [Puniceicoccales bacterium]